MRLLPAKSICFLEPDHVILTKKIRYHLNIIKISIQIPNHFTKEHFWSFFSRWSVFLISFLCLCHVESVALMVELQCWPSSAQKEVKSENHFFRSKIHEITRVLLLAFLLCFAFGNSLQWKNSICYMLVLLISRVNILAWL